MSRTATRPANPAPAIHSTNRDPDTSPFSPRPYSFVRPFPTLPEKWRSPLDQDKLLNEYLSHDGYFATFAQQRGLSVDQLYDWLHSEEVAARRKRMETMAQERTDLLARLARPAAIQALLHLITQGCMNHNQTRLAASALLRAAESADRREERQAREEARTQSASSPAVPRATGSPGRPCDPPATSPPSSPDIVALPKPTSLLPSRILARIGPSGSPIPRKPRQGATPRVPGARSAPA